MEPKVVCVEMFDPLEIAIPSNITLDPIKDNVASFPWKDNLTVFPLRTWFHWSTVTGNPLMKILFPEDVIVNTFPSTVLEIVCSSTNEDIQEEDEKSMLPEQGTGVR